MLTMNVYNNNTKQWEPVHSGFSKTQLDNKMDKKITDENTDISYEITFIDGRLAIKKAQIDD